ncbi:stress-activated map kinase interacting protein 1-domain-containing protein [Sparassis latifolia]|uniref:Stress-activated map kinase-interacting protein n=1 Tax=Sparassis crispa TaxID=139825 RepID=A0A401GZS1_9APHY|nr:Stress-activated map kinase-interacting protein [Sparassis crispa]GBE87664.1 Stress-activated map kinase-interacting protein [Sparassis crispa]
MSLISDPDFLIHSLRLNYLRNVDDPYGPRIISLDPSYHSNQYIVTSGLADVERWPELAMPSSPTPSDDESGVANRPNRHLGATGLKYTTTIMGPSRVGTMGLRVSGKRASSSRASFKYSVRSEGAVMEPQPEEQDADVVPVAPSASPMKLDALDLPVHTSSGDGTTPVGNHAVASEDLTQEPAPSPQFIPRFKGAAEMEARRKLRMLARASPGVVGTKPLAASGYLDPELSSSESSSSDGEDDIIDEEDFDLAADADDSMDIDGDEFDPDFATSHGPSGLGGIISDSVSDDLSMSSASVISDSNSSLADSSLQPSNNARIHDQLSPVSEGRTREEKLPDRPEETAPLSGFEMVTPAPKITNRGRAGVVTNPAKHSSMFPDSSSPPSSALFARRPVPPAAPGKSALTAMMAASSTSSSSNPFSELYSAISGRSESESMTVHVYFPHSREPAGRILDLKVRKDATVEEVLGFALWSYWEEGWLPELDEGLDGEEDPKWVTKCSAIGWIFRIAEEDGEVDEDFPPPDRTGKISKFNFDAYAVLEATPAQVQQNKILESKIQRRASRVVIKKKKSAGLLNLTSTLAPPTDSLIGTSAGLSSLGSSLGMFPSSLGPSTSQGPPIYLRCRIADTADAGHVSTTIQASGGMYMAEVLEGVCQRRKLSDSKDYALILDLGTTKVYIPLDRTVRSLQGKRDLILMKKGMLPSIGVEMGQGTDRTTDPNASILKRNSEVPEQPFSSLFDYTNAYRKYTVYRKVPMLVTRSARLLAIDGGYIHIMPLSNKAKHVFESGKTASYPLKSVVACQQSSNNSSSFKLVVQREADRNKRYEFETENPQTASEIVQTIRSLKLAMERPGTLKQSRRSKHVNKEAAQAYMSLNR